MRTAKRLVLAGRFADAGPPSPTAGMVQTFNEPFSALSLRTGGPTRAGYLNGSGIWVPRSNLDDGSDPNGWQPATEEQYYDDPAASAVNPFSIDGNGLTIRAQKIANAWHSGYLSTRFAFSQREGYFEFCARMPAGRGLWPACWLLAANGSTPPEIDIEYRGDLPTQLHVALNPDGAFVSRDLAPGNLSQAFHRYGVLWTSTALTYYLDGVALYSVDITGKTAMRQPCYLILDLAVGGTSGFVPASDGTTPNPANFQSGYVKAWAAPTTNLWTFGSDFSNGVWTKNGLTIANAGDPAAQAIKEMATTENHAINRTIAKAAAPKTYHVSFDCEGTLGRSLIRVNMTPGSGAGVGNEYSSGARVNFYVDTGFVGNSGQYGGFAVVAGTPSIAFIVGNGNKRRCTFDVTTDASPTVQLDLFVELAEDGDPYAGDVAKGIKITNAQLVDIN